MVDRILVVDDDEWILRGVAAALRSSAYEVFCASDGQDALEAAAARRPDLIITDIVMPRLDGWNLVRSLRARPEFALTPVIFLTSQSSADDRLRGFRLGADDYLLKPLDFSDILRRVGSALERSRRLAKDLGAGPAIPQGGSMGRLRGTIDQVGLASLLQVLEMGRKTGVVEFRRNGPSPELGHIFLVEGVVHRADVEGHQRLANREAVYHLVGWDAGSFEFTPGVLRLPDDVKCPLSTMLLEAARRFDESRRT